MRLTTILLFCSFPFWGWAQNAPTFTVSVSSDSVLMGHRLQVAFTLEDADGSDFKAPSFAGFELISGPNQSSSMQMINGDVTRSVSYTYWLRPKFEGPHLIEEASITTDEGTLMTEPVEVIVHPNPDNIPESRSSERQSIFDSFFDNPFFEGIEPPQTTPRERPSAPQRKTYKL